MKKCPVCSANVFEDMDTCYNCMHSFKDDYVRQEPRRPLEIPQISAPVSNFISPQPSKHNAENQSKPFVSSQNVNGDMQGSPANHRNVVPRYNSADQMNWAVQNMQVPNISGQVNGDDMLDFLNSYYSFLGSYLQSKQSNNVICNN